MTETFYPSMDDALAAVAADYPDAARVLDVEPMFCDSFVFHDAASHTVCVVGPNECADGRTEGIVSAVAAHEVATAPMFTENFESASGYWDERNAVMSKAAVALELIYSEAVRERGFAGNGPTERPSLDVEIALGQAIDRAREQLFLLESLRVRFYRRLVSEADSPKEARKVLEDLHVRDDAWQEMQVDDFRRFGPDS